MQGMNAQFTVQQVTMEVKFARNQIINQMKNKSNKVRIEKLK